MNANVLCMKTRSVLVGLMICLIMGLTGLTLTGCDDGDSYDARLEEALMALDDGNYALARSILDSLPQTEEVMQYKSNAVAGGIGIDTFNIISTLEELDEQGDEGSIDMVGRVIAGDDGELSEDEIREKLADADEAIDLFLQIAALRKDEATKSIDDIPYLTDDQKMQLGLLGITRTVLTLADMICRKLGGTAVTMTEAWIQNQRHAFLPFDTLGSTEITDAELVRIEEDLRFIEAAIDAFADTNDMKNDFEEFLSELDANADGDITRDELNAYLGGM